MVSWANRPYQVTLCRWMLWERFPAEGTDATWSATAGAIDDRTHDADLETVALGA